MAGRGASRSCGDKAFQQHKRKFADYVIKRVSATSGKVISTPVPRLITVSRS